MEIFKLPQGEIIVSYSDSKLSTGVLHLRPGQGLDKHNRPVAEQLVQITGICNMKLFDGDSLLREVILRQGDSLVIPAHQYHIHSNSTNEASVTLWKFEGDITAVIQKIREQWQ